MDAQSKTIYLPWAVTRAMLHLAAKKGPRMYLTGVYVEAKACETRLTATDGKVLGTWRHVIDARGDLTNDTGADVFRGIVPRAAIEELRKPRASDRRAMLALAVDESGQCRIDNGRPFALIDAPYPDYRHLFRDIESRETSPAQFDPNLLVRFARFAKDADLSGCRCPGVRHAGEAAALVGLDQCPDFVGLVAPYRMPEPGFQPLAWVLDDMAPAAVEQAAA